MPAPPSLVKCSHKQMAADYRGMVPATLPPEVSGSTTKKDTTINRDCFCSQIYINLRKCFIRKHRDALYLARTSVYTHQYDESAL